MSDEQPRTSQRLRGWFWLALFAPTLISVPAPLMTRWLHIHNVLGWLFSVNIVIALPLNFVCSNWLTTSCSASRSLVTSSMELNMR